MVFKELVKMPIWCPPTGSQDLIDSTLNKPRSTKWALMQSETLTTSQQAPPMPGHRVSTSQLNRIRREVDKNQIFAEKRYRILIRDQTKPSATAYHKIWKTFQSIKVGCQLVLSPWTTHLTSRTGLRWKLSEASPTSRLISSSSTSASTVWISFQKVQLERAVTLTIWIRWATMEVKWTKQKGSQRAIPSLSPHPWWVSTAMGCRARPTSVATQV